MVREEARVGTTQNLLQYMRLFRLSARLCSCGIYFPSKVRKLKYNRGMVMLYTRQCPSYTW